MSRPTVYAGTTVRRHRGTGLSLGEALALSGGVLGGRGRRGCSGPVGPGMTARRDRARYRRRPRTDTGRPVGMQLPEKQLAMVYPLAGRHGVSEADVQVVRAAVATPYARQCDG